MNSLIKQLEDEFIALDRRSRELINDKRTGVSELRSIVRAAAVIEQTCNGITTRLWDDPFEWTLPEKLSTPAAVLEYLDEVEAARQYAFTFFTTDADLHRQTPAPERLTPLIDILRDTLKRAGGHQADTQRRKPDQ